jgi:hypothetical protein
VFTIDRNRRSPSTGTSVHDRLELVFTIRRNAHATVDHYPEVCTACGEALTAAMATGHVARKMFDLPEPMPLIVTEHRAHDCRCIICGTQTRAAFPNGVTAPVQYGNRIGAFVLYLLTISCCRKSVSPH